MKPARWFLPHEPDVLGLLSRQLAIMRGESDVSFDPSWLP